MVVITLLNKIIVKYKNYSMKTRYLLTALTLPLLAACTQDEFDVQVNNGNAALQGRVEVGKVAFTTGANTRFDFGDAEHIGWEDGERFGLFLMDDWNEAGNAAGNGEQLDANETDFKDQQVWNNMYSLHNYTQTNIPFTFNRTEGIWENDDAVVEGNYFALAPANGQKTSMEISDLGSIRNRRDVWVYINPVQKFGNEPAGQYNQLRGGIEQNQFFLGYQQVYRNQELTNGEQLMLPLQLRPILGMVDLTIENSDEKSFIVQKIVMRRLDGAPMPTIAYIRPDGNTTEDFPKYLDGTSTWNANDTYKDFGPAFAQPYDAAELTDACGEPYTRFTYNPETWTRSAARSVVEYSYPGENGFIPYGLKGDAAEPVYEYTFDFTGENEDAPDGYILNNGDFFHAYLALPHNMYLKEYSFTIYGLQKDNTTIGGPTWKEGIIIPSAGDYVDLPTPGDENDGHFNLVKVDLASEKNYLQAKVEFDDFMVQEKRVATVSNSDDLLRYLKMYEDSYNMGTNEIFYITTLGDFEVTRELCDYVRDLNESKGSNKGGKAIIYFEESKNGKLVFPEGLDSDAIDLFFYTKKVDILNKGTQVIEEPIMQADEAIEIFKEALKDSDKSNGIFSMANDGVSLLDKLEAAKAAAFTNSGIHSIVNEGVLTINAAIETGFGPKAGIYNESGAIMEIGAVIISNDVEGYPYSINGNGAAYVQNKGALNLKGTMLDGTLKNARETTVESTTAINTVKNFNNIADCKDCPTGIAKLIVTENSTLEILNGVNGSEDGLYVGQVENYGSFAAEEEFVNYQAKYPQAIDEFGQGNLIINGSKELAGNHTNVSMSGIVNKSGSHEVAVKYDDLLTYNEGIRNFCKLSVKNYGYIYQADAYAHIQVMNTEDYYSVFDNVLANDKIGVIENTVDGNIYGYDGQNGTISNQIIILTVKDQKTNLTTVSTKLKAYSRYNKVVLKGTEVSGKLNFADEVVGEVEFASDETRINSSSAVQLAAHYVKVMGTVRVGHGQTLQLGNKNPEINTTVYGLGEIIVENGGKLEGLGTLMGGSRLVNGMPMNYWDLVPTVFNGGIWIKNN